MYQLKSVASIIIIIIIIIIIFFVLFHEFIFVCMYARVRMRAKSTQTTNVNKPYWLKC